MPASPEPAVASLLPAVQEAGLRLDPRTKIAMLLIVNVVFLAVTVAGRAAWAAPALAAVIAVLLLTARMHVIATGFALLFAAGWCAQALPLPRLDAPWSFLVAGLAGVAVRVLPTVALAAYIVATTPVSRFVAAMQRLRLPMTVTVPMTVMLRYLPTITEERRAIRDALRLRGLTGIGSLVHPLRALQYRSVPLLTSLVRGGDELAAAALTRGLGAPGRRTSIEEIGMGAVDWMLIVLVATLAGLYGFA